MGVGFVEVAPGPAARPLVRAAAVHAVAQPDGTRASRSPSSASRSTRLAIMANGGYMPVWMDAYAFAGLTGPLNSRPPRPAVASVDAEFLLRLGPLGDIIPLPIPPFQNVASIGDLFLSAGLAFFLFATLLRSPAEAQRRARRGARGPAAGRRRHRAASSARHRTARPPGSRSAASTGLSPALEETAALERPLLLGSAAPARQPRPTAGSPTARSSRRRSTRSPAVGHPSSRASGATRTSASRSTARSRRCGSAR